MTLSLCSICDLSLDVERSPKAPGQILILWVELSWEMVELWGIEPVGVPWVTGRTQDALLTRVLIRESQVRPGLSLRSLIYPVAFLHLSVHLLIATLLRAQISGATNFGLEIYEPEWSSLFFLSCHCVAIVMKSWLIHYYLLIFFHCPWRDRHPGMTRSTEQKTKPNQMQHQLEKSVVSLTKSCFPPD